MTGHSSTPPAGRVSASARVAELLTEAGGLYNRHTIKGDSGAVIVVGGSQRYPGPPILAVRAAVRTGVDDARAIVPGCCWTDPVRADVHLNRAGADELDPGRAAAAVTSLADELLPRCRAGMPARIVLLIGPGLGGHPQPDKLLAALTASRQQLGDQIVTVVDGHLGGGMQGQNRMHAMAPDVVLLSHQEATGLLPRLDDTTLATTAAHLKAVLVVKGDTDRITGPDAGATRTHTDGAVQLTKSGTGDVLAGAVCGLLAHGLPPIRAAELGCWLIQAASSRARDRHGPGFLPTELADQLSSVLLPAEGPR